MDCPSDGSVGLLGVECRSGLDLTIAFEDYILILIPAASLLLLAPIRLRTIWSRTIKVHTPTILQLVKTFSAFAFMGCSFAVLVATCARQHSARVAEISAATVLFLASNAAYILSYLEHNRSIRPSQLLQLYLIIALIAQVIHLRTIWIRQNDITLQALYTAEVASCAVFLLVESIGKESILLSRQKRSPQDTSDIFSQRLFLYLNNLFRRGYSSLLAPNDLDDIDEDISSLQYIRRFRLEWLRHYSLNPEVSLFRIIYSGLRYDTAFPIIPRLLELGVSFAQPFLIMRFVKYLSTSNAPSEEGVFLVLSTGLTYTLLAILQGWYWQSVNRWETKIRGCLITLLHDKALRSRPDDASSPLTLQNVDVEKVTLGLRSLYEYPATLLSVGIALALLYVELGLVFLAPLILTVVLIAITTLNGAKVAPKQVRWLSATQSRISYITGVVNTMRNIKLLGIAENVLRTGNNLRDEEVRAQRRIRKGVLINIFISQATFQSCCLVLFSAYAIRTARSGEPLTSARLFTSLSILKLFTTPMLSTVQYLPLTLQAFAALGRIQSYLVRKDFVEKRNLDLAAPSIDLTLPIAARMKNVTCGYAEDESLLTGLNCHFYKSSLTIVTGSVGSGKSTLLKTLLGETYITHGLVELTSASVAFCNQSPWIWNATIADNIVGMEPYDQAWLHRVTRACGLHDDFKQLSAGIHAIVGSDGAALSGGQKNRICLARAVYSRKQIMVIDDMLSGLDTRTEQLVFRAVFNGLLRELGSTVILATHSVGWMKYADYVIALDCGTIDFHGAPNQMFATSGDLEGPPSQIMRQGDKTRSKIGDSVTEIDEPVAQPSSDVSRTKASRPTSDFRVYKEFFISFGIPSSILWVGFMTSVVGLDTLQTLWLKWWAAAEATSSHELGYYAGTFAGIFSVWFSVMTIYFTFTLLYLLTKSSLYLHARQWTALIKVAFPSWGDKETGSVINRFSQDITVVDSTLGNAWINTAHGFFAALASSGMLVVATPYIAAAFPLLISVFWVIQSIYLRTSKQLRIMDLEAKAPLCTHFLETVSGVSTIHAFGWDENYREKNAILLKASQQPFYLMASIQQWLSLVLNLVVAGLATVVMAIAVRLRDDVDAGYLGLAMLSIMDLGQWFMLVVTSWTLLETSLGAIARMNEFVDSMPPEDGETITPPPGWLAEGRIDISNLTAAYSQTAEPILKDINLAIQPGEKIAICGRTGSGKSSVASGFFGLLHVVNGSIQIDGLDIAKIPKDTLRSKMIALPQDPYFSPGTVRQNLALRPGEADDIPDSLMTETLAKVGLGSKFDTIATASEGNYATALDVELKPMDMLTKGQMQLFAMARAMLQKGQIVLIDEATSGLDAVSEALVQKLLREAFAGRTIIAIAHHLTTIMDFDRVVVLDGGEIAEIGKPNELREVDGSLFGALVDAAERQH